MKPKTKCQYCAPLNVLTCQQMSFSGYRCTREQGHKGDHVTCRYEVHNIYTWSQDPKQYDHHYCTLCKQSIKYVHLDTHRCTTTPTPRKTEADVKDDSQTPPKELPRT